MKKLLICLLVVACLTGLCFAAEAKTASEAKATWTDGTETFEGTFGECLTKAAELGGTVTMLEDVAEAGEHPTTRNDIDDADYIVGADRVFTLDMNGHSLSASCGAIYINGGEEGGVFVVKNGTIFSEAAENLYVRNAGMQVLNMTMRSVKAQNISYYEATDTYNKDNLIEGCTIYNAIWHALSFNSAVENQEKASVTIINSTLAGLKSAAPLGLQKKPAGSTAQVVLGEGVKLCTYNVKPMAAAITLLGEPFIKQEMSVTVELTEEDVYDLVNIWYTPEKPSVDLASVIPGETEPHTENSPALRKVTLVPFEEQKAALEAAEKAEEVPAPAPVEQEEADSSTGLIIAIVAAVVVAAAVVIVIVGKKKK